MKRIILLLIGAVCIMSGCKSVETKVEEPPVTLEYYHKTFGKQAIKSINKDSEVIIGKKQVYNDLYNAMEEYFEKQKQVNK
jgi:phosphotransferase system IIB component